MVDANRFTISGPTAIAADPALIRSGIEPAASGGGAPSSYDSAETSDVIDTAPLERLTHLLETLVARLETLTELTAPPGEKPGEDGDSATRGVTSREIEAAADALIYTDFFQKAIDLGMSPNMVADAYKLADLAGVTANLETKEVTGTNAAINSLLEKRPYLFIVHQIDIGTETNPVKGPSSHPEEVEGLARTLGVSPDFAAALVRKRSDKVRGDAALSEIWRIPRANRLSFLETNE